MKEHRIAFRVDTELLEAIDRIAREAGHNNRSVALRSLLDVGLSVVKGEDALMSALYDAQELLKGPLRRALAMTVTMLTRWPEDESSRWINLGRKDEPEGSA